MTDNRNPSPQTNVDKLEAQIAFTLTDASRLLRKQDVQEVCPHPDDCFYESDRVRCGPCAVKASAAKGVEIDDTHSHLPEVCRLRRDLKAASARITELESAPAPAPNVRVKPLDWRGNEASSPVGNYRIQRLSDKWEPLHNGHYMLPRVHGMVEAFDTPEEARAFVKADYEKNVRSALEDPSPAPDVRPVPTSDEVEKYREARGPEWSRAYDALREFHLSNIRDEDGYSYPLVDLMTRDGVQITDGEMELVDMLDTIFEAIRARAPDTSSVRTEHGDGVLFGVALSVAFLIRDRDEPTIAREWWDAAGMTIEECERVGLDEYDLDPIRALAAKEGKA